ncbi:hypothetical protein K1719_019097 [Acacia pycnantha]|nr:hypothetical protein K1719_019097 [Acacia pycnantha]
MMPAYRSTDSHPYHRNNMAFSHYNQPVMEGFPPQMNMDPSKSPSAYEQPWPYLGGHGFPTPMQFCCGHRRFPGYWTYMPAYPHIPTSSPPMCFSGGYPAYVEPFYVPYAPPPHYNMELPRYEYDKCMPREHHCCGCPNDPLSHKEGKGVKIEEHEPDSENKVNNAMSPSQLQNHPYPFVWMPPQYMDNKELETPDAKEVGDQHDRKPSQKLWNGWFPLDINGLANKIQDGNGRKNESRQIDNGEDGKTNPSQQSDRNKREFPFPVFWIPNYIMQEGERTKGQESDSPPNSVIEVPRALNSAPVLSHSSDDASNRSNVDGNDLKVGASDVTRKETDERNIPIKQMEVQKSEPESHEKRVRDIPVKQIGGDVTGKEAQASVKRQSDSPKKTSKLPPVCLRVDPLPRKKNGDGSSRSPSPSKKGSAASTNGTSKSSSSSSMHDKALEDAKHQHVSDVGPELKPKEKTIKVMEMPSEKKDGEQRDGSESHGKTQALQKDSNTNEDFKPKSKSIKVLEKSSEKKLEDHIDGTQSQVTSKNDTGVHKDSSALTSTGESGNEAERKVNDMIKEEAIEATDAKDAKERKVLSDTEAAALIQAAYRGFQVRKWEPLKKLKQIAEVSKHVTDVRGSIQALEASSNKQIDEKEKVTIGETIMRLLLKLDTIQGLHPSFREMRKSLARELTSLQEKLDSVVAKKSQLHVEDQSVGKLMTSTVGSNGEYMQKQPEEEVSMAGKDSSEGIIQESHGCSEQQAEEIAASKNSPDSIIHTSQDMVEQGQDQLSIKNGNSSNDDEKLQYVAHSLPVDDGKCGSSSPIDQLFNEKLEPLPEETNNEALNKFSEVEASGCDISELQPKTKSELEDTPNEADELDMKAWEELPQGVIDDLEADNIDFRKDKENEIEGEELQISKVTNTSGDNFAQDGESSKMHEMEELPIGLLDDDTTDSENHEETGTSAQVLQSEGGELTHSSAYNISKETQLDQLQQQLEEQEENQSKGESDDWVKVQYEQDGLKGDVSENVKVETDSREENDEQSVNDGHGVANEDACLEVKEATVTETPEEEVAVKEEQSELVIKDDDEQSVNDGQGVAYEDACLEVKEVTVTKTPEEEVAVKEEQSEQVIKDDAENKEVLSEKMGEQCVTSPLPKKDGEMGTDRSLIEENEKLRKMMQKLLEAGNEQLTVISNLAGRVKDLEKKLAKKKRVKTIHCRPTTSKPSFKKSSNNQLHDRITEVAM